MKRIDSVNARPNVNGPGKPGFHDNNDISGQDATYLTPDWLNHLQEEICAVIEKNGHALNSGQRDQLFQILATHAEVTALADAVEQNFFRKSKLNNTLTSSATDEALTAAQGKVLQDNKLEKTANAVSASKLLNARTIFLTGAVSGSGSFDGSGDLTIDTELNNFTSLKTENGYKYLGDGLILQWGTVDYPSYPGEIEATANFPITFPNRCLNFVATRKLSGHASDGDGAVHLISTTQSTATVSLQIFGSTSNGSLRGFTWFAIGV